MKTFILLSIHVLSQSLMAQTPIQKSITVQQGQTISMHFDYPELIRVSTWEKNEISIQGTVSINGGENDDAFELQLATSGNVVTVRNEIKDMKNLPHRITVVDGAKKLVFKNKEDWKKYQAEHGKGNYTMESYGTDMEILLEIKVPRNFQTSIKSVYGMVEVKQFYGPLTVVSTYGGVDAALSEKNIGVLTAETNFGEIFSNLNTRFGDSTNRDENFHTVVSAKPGNGPAYNFESKYGNVYLRKAN
ncbi:MAG: hypothetical protein JNM57_16740 [Cyclobacteriaceae bacterium]|nr:hypothetical protein [Cyclobacteriaceae bacterium]